MTTAPFALSIHPDRTSAIHALACHIVELSRVAISERGRFTWALAGGSTPKELYQLLTSREFTSQIEWPKVEIFWGDERCVPPDSPDSNYKMADEALLSQVSVRAARVHRMAGELDPAAAAERYNFDLTAAFPSAHYPHLPPSFDLILLGMGDDGHTASLFPESPALQVRNQWVCPAKKGDQWRLTLTFPVLNAARELSFLVLGSGKRTMLQNIINDQSEQSPWPAAHVQPTQGRVIWFVDSEAAPRSASDIQAVE